MPKTTSYRLLIVLEAGIGFSVLTMALACFLLLSVLIIIQAVEIRGEEFLGAFPR